MPTPQPVRIQKDAEANQVVSAGAALRPAGNISKRIDNRKHGKSEASMRKLRTLARPIAQEVLIAEVLTAIGNRSAEWRVELDVRCLIGLSKAVHSQDNQEDGCTSNMN
jgi:hypothetical protein